MSVSETASFLKVDGVCSVLQHFITNTHRGQLFFKLLFRFCNGDVVLLAVALVRAHSL